jgi:hypothetical protein
MFWDAQIDAICAPVTQEKMTSSSALQRVGAVAASQGHEANAEIARQVNPATERMTAFQDDINANQ